jgi:hypothetical protein
LGIDFDFVEKQCIVVEPIESRVEPSKNQTVVESNNNSFGFDLILVEVYVEDMFALPVKTKTVAIAMTVEHYYHYYYCY